MTDVLMPKLGMTMEFGFVTEWLVEVGDQIDEGAPLVEVATEKVENVVGAPVSGRVEEILVPADDDAEVPVGSVLARIEQGGDR